MANIVINGQAVECPDGAPLVEVIKNAGVWISNLCYIDGLPPYAGCRTCLVEIEGARGLQLSCTSVVRDGMVVRTNSEEASDARKMVISLINANHPDRCLSCHRRIKCKPGDICLRDDVVTHRCLTCSKNYRCELQTTNELAEMQQYEPFTGEDRSYYGRQAQPPRDVYNPYLEFDPQMCIICTRCVRACDDLHNTQAITLAGKGWQTRIAFGAPSNGRDGYVHESNCDFCGTCIDVCPTAALMEHPNKWVANTSTWANTSCNYCAVGCSLRMGTRSGKGVLVRPDPLANQFSRDQICVRGRFHYDAITDADRIGRPLRRRGEVMTATNWEAALNHTVGRLAEIISDSGPDSVAFLGSPYATTEENYLLARLAREVVGSPFIDSSAGPVAEAVDRALEDTLGTRLLPSNMEDFTKASIILVCAQDIEQTHPVASTRLKDGVVKNGARLVYISSRYGELCDFAHVWLQPPPGLEAATLLALAQEVGRPPVAAPPVGEGVDQVQHPNSTSLDTFPTASETGSAESEEIVTKTPTLQGLDALLGERVPDLPEGLTEAIRDAAAILTEGKSRLPQGPMAFVLAPPELNPLSAGAQARAMVDLALLVAGAGNGPLWTHVLPAQPNVNGMRDAGVRPAPGHDFDEVMRGAFDGNIKAIVCLRDNPLFSAPDRAFVRAALERLDFLVVIDELLGDTAKLAHVVLPDVSVWGKDGTVVSADRRLMRQEAAISPVEEARPAWLILSQLGARLAEKLDKDKESWHYHSASAVMESLGADPASGALFPTEPWCENSSGLRQEIGHPPQVRLVSVRPPEVNSTRDGNEFTLLTHRGQFTSYEAAQIRRADADRLGRESQALIHRLDAGRLGAADRDIVAIVGPNGSMEAPIAISEHVLPGTVFVPLYLDGAVVTNVLGHSSKELVAPRVRLELTGRRASQPADPVAQGQPEASGMAIIPLEKVVSATGSGRLG